VATRVVGVPTFAIGIFGTALLILVLRYPTALFAAEPMWEDGPIFYLGAFDGLGSLGRPYQGYLHLAARLVAIAATTLPPALAPLLMNAVTILVTAGVAAFIASERLRTAVPDRRIRLALAIGFVLMPASQDLTWHLVYLQWSLGFFLLVRVLADEPGPRWVWIDRTVVGLASLTGPFSILFAPLYVWRRRQLGPTTWIVVACALVQLAFVAASRRTPAGETTLTDAIAVLATRLFVEPLLGYRVTAQLSDAGVPLTVGGAFVVVVIGLIAVAARAIPSRTLAVLVYAALVVAVAGSALGGPGLEPPGRLERRPLFHVRDRRDRGHRDRVRGGRWALATAGGDRARWVAPDRRHLGFQDPGTTDAWLGREQRLHRRTRSVRRPGLPRWRLGHPVARPVTRRLRAARFRTRAAAGSIRDAVDRR